MTRTATSANKTIGGLAAVAVTAAVFATTSLGSAPAANATCASFFGMGNGGGCTSTFGSVAIAIGTGATATANGLFGTAFAVGTDSVATIFSGSFLDWVTAVGEKATATAHGAGGVSMAFGNNVQALAGTDSIGPVADFKNPVGNLAIDIATNAGNNGSVAAAIGYGNVALDLGSGFATVAEAIGSLSTGVNLFGTRSLAEAFDLKDPTDLTAGFANSAFSVFGSRNIVESGPGPFAIAGSVFQTGATVKKSGPGLNVNGLSVGGAAAPVHHTSSTATKSSVGAPKRTTTSAAAPKHSSKK